ncbi:zinc-dependent alcohol dehydrogenase family protein [Elioraea sp.]|uniref:zinc-dependent alcohol dehydrogenase family protein n=1 Tax=Elioraea sp. TaxID=2185103 RepID=UPI0025BEE8F2|nr:zinc-dependent alcohol dehydrogenase family protein [Elioraea sp.]
MMKAMVIDRFGGPEVFQAATLPDPVAGPGEVLVAIAAASVNPVDWKLRTHGPAIAPALPAVLGTDFAGHVVALGDGVSGFAVGDAVYGCAGGVRGMPGAYAGMIAADALLIAHAPKGLSMREAAALPLVTITAWEGLHDRARIGAGDTVLIHGGTGGVGHIALQVAAAAGARVFATVSSAEKATLARTLGAAETIDYRNEMPEAYVARLTGGRGFDVVFDATGGKDIATSFAAVRTSGQVVTIVSQYTADLAPMHGKGLSLHVVFMLLPMLTGLGRDRHGAILTEAARLVEAGKLRPLLDPHRFPLEDVAAAHAHLESGKAIGKVVLEVA